jgi:hypothetical protein
MKRIARIPFGEVGVLLAACVAVGCSTGAVKTSPDSVSSGAVDLKPLSASAGVGGVRVRTDVSSNEIRLPDYVAVRRYGDVFSKEGVNRRVTVEYGWDYRRGVVVETVYDENGSEMSKADKPGFTLNFTDRELELAFALAREAPALRSVLAADDLNFYAGFPYREATEPECSAGSRCVHVIVSAGDGQRHVAHAIVDLMSRRVIHSALDAWRKPDPVAGKS